MGKNGNGNDYQCNHLWDSSRVAPGVIEFCAALDNKPRPPYDDALIQYQLKLNHVYTDELLRLGCINKMQYYSIRKGLRELSKLYSKGKLTVEGYEDVQTMVESKLHKWYGDRRVGNMAIGLSRNDQVITITRMWMKEQAKKTLGDLESIISIIDEKREETGKLAMVGYSHHRVAMPTTYGELLRSYAEQLKRDKISIKCWLKEYDESPLGAGAGFGPTIRLNRMNLAKALGFKRPTKSTIDTVTTRWEAEYKLASNISVIMNRLSTMACDLIQYSMEGINTVTLPPEYCTGSSIMPQKRNPDVLESIKARAVDIQHNAGKLIHVGGNNISGYNRDNQWTKYWIMDVFYALDGCLYFMSKVIEGAKVNDDRAGELLGESNADSAKMAARESIKNKKPFRSTKLRVERNLK